MIHKEFFFDIILQKLLNAALWRQSVALKFPGDTRNTAAVRELTKLARSRFCDVRPESWEAIGELLETYRFGHATHVAARNVCFRSYPADINEFVRSIAATAEVLARVERAAA